MQKPRFLQGFVKTCFQRPRAAQDAPKEAQEAARTAPEWPGAAQGRAKRGPRATKSDPKVRPGSPRTGQGAAQEQPRRALKPQGPPGVPKWPFGGPKMGPREKPKKGLGEAQHTTQEDTRAEKPRQEDTSGDKTTEDKTRGKTRQQTDKRTFPIHEGRVHFTRRQLTSRAFNARVHASTLFLCRGPFPYLEPLPGMS